MKRSVANMQSKIPALPARVSFLTRIKLTLKKAKLWVRALRVICSNTDIKEDVKKHLATTALTLFTAPLFGGLDLFFNEGVTHRSELGALTVTMFLLLLFSFVSAQTASTYGSLKLADLLLGASYILIPIMGFLILSDFVGDIRNLILAGVLLIVGYAFFSFVRTLHYFMKEVNVKYKQLKSEQGL